MKGVDLYTHKRDCIFGGPNANKHRAAACSSSSSKKQSFAAVLLDAAPIYRTAARLQFNVPAVRKSYLLRLPDLMKTLEHKEDPFVLGW